MRHSTKELLRLITLNKIARAHLSKLIEEKNKTSVRLAEVNQILKGKQSELVRLEKHPFLGKYTKIWPSGTENKDLDLVKQAYLELVVEHDQLHNVLEAIEYEIELVKGKTIKESELKKQLKQVLLLEESDHLPSALEKFRHVFKKLEKYYRLRTEIEEAIAQGKRLNNRFNAALKFVRDKTQHVFDQRRRASDVLAFRVDRVQKYQKLVVLINHDLIKYSSELEDVYRELIGKNSNLSHHIEHFLAEFRANLIVDLKMAKGLDHSEHFLKGHKSNLMSLTRVLRHDLKEINQKISAIEQEEKMLLKEITEE